ncbi:MAG: sigma-70 family RNA polymerase sigma factor [Phycisphaerales bacterium]
MTSIPWTKGAGLRRDEDHSLVERALDGDPRAFAQLVAVHRDYVTRLAHRLLGWDPDIEDVVQEVFIRVWQRRGQVREPTKFRGWLAAVTVNAARSRLRHKRVRRVLLLNFGQTASAAVCDERIVGEMIERDETGRQVREAVNALPQRDKEVLVLRYLEQMTVEEVAGALGLRANAVEVRLHRARKRLADRLPKELRS